MAETLDGLDVAFCLFDEEDRTLLWNRTFLLLFPEHDGHVHVGEPYAENLRRFYRGILPPAELPEIERFVAGGIARHRTQARPFTFQHRDQWLRVASTAVPGLGRYRIWTRVAAPGQEAVLPPERLRSPALDPVLENLAEGVAVLDAEGLIVTANERFLSLYGMAQRESVRGKSLSTVLKAAWRDVPVDERERMALAATLVRLAEDQRFSGAPFEVRLPGDRWVRVTERRASDGVVCSTHSNITDLKRQQEEMVAARDAADRANRAKSAFLAKMSHEIRTPMNGILGLSNILLDGSLDEGQRDYAEALHRSASALLVILNDLLDASRLEMGKLRLESIPFDLSQLVAEMALLLAPSAMEKGVRLAWSVVPELGGSFLGDPTRLRQVLLNLLSNAMKFTAEGEILLLATPVREAGGGVRIEVSDTGIGIDPASVDRLFETFEQADTSIARRYGGTGLGLSIARQIVELMGGRIGAEPREGGGSLFWCEVPLPRADAAQAAQALQPAAPAPVPAGQGDVLVVEDNATNQAVVRAMLRKAGFHVRVAPDGLSAVAMAQESWPDLVLMDLQLPDMDGFEVTQRLRALSRAGTRLPIVAVTANAMPEDLDLCLAQGMDDYLSKPFTPAALIGKVLKWVPPPGGTPAPATPP